MQRYLHQGIPNGNFPVRKISRLHGSDKIRLLESLEPSIFPHLCLFIGPDERIEGSRNDVLGFD
jgi:hypothetical protein